MRRGDYLAAVYTSDTIKQECRKQSTPSPQAIPPVLSFEEGLDKMILWGWVFTGQEMVKQPPLSGQSPGKREFVALVGTLGFRQ